MNRLLRPIPVLLVLLPGCTPGGGDEPAEELDFSAFDEAVEGVLVDLDLAGATAVVVRRDEGVVHHAAFGEFEVDRVSLLASASKMVTAGVLMRLTDQGLLDINEPLGIYLSDWGERPTDLTAAQLLSNSSGLVGLVDDPTYAPYLCQYVPTGTLSECAGAIYTADDGDDIVCPDTAFRYGGGQWQLAGGLAEEVSGLTWAELIQETYVEPCEVTSLGYTNHYFQAFVEGDGTDGAFVYPDYVDGDPSTLPQTDNPNVEGGGYGTVLDYGTLLLMHLHDGECGAGRSLSPEAVARMAEDRIGEVYGGSTFASTWPGYGLGWWVSRDEPGVVADGGTYGAIPWLDRERGYGAMIVLESRYEHASVLYDAAKPILDGIFDADD